jgi:hypothetical protein
VTRGARVAFTAALLAFTLLMLVLTFGLGARSRLIPLVVVIPLAAALGWQLLRDWRGTDPGRQRGSHLTATARAPLTEAPVDASAAPAPWVGKARTSTAIVWIALLPLLATVLGFLLGPALFVLLWARGRGGERPVIAFTAAAVTLAGVYALFTWLLETPIPQGLLLQMLRP